MDVLGRIKNSIKRNDESAIDTLLFISKIESLKQDNKDSKLFDSVAQMVRNFYESKYKTPYSKEAQSLYEYIGKEIDKDFYNLNEINVENYELLTNKIVKRMKQIKGSSCSFDYKFNSLILLYEYLRELSPEDNNEDSKEATILLGKMLCRKAFINIVRLVFLSYPFWLPNVVSHFIETFKGTPKELIYFSLITATAYLIVFYTAFLYIYLKGIFKKFASFALITGLIYASIIIPNFIIDIKTDISKYPEEVVVIDAVTQSSAKNIKYATVKRIDGQKETLLFHSDLGLEYNKTYNIKYNKSKIIVSAEEIQ